MRGVPEQTSNREVGIRLDCAQQGENFQLEIGGVGSQLERQWAWKMELGDQQCVQGPPVALCVWSLVFREEMGHMFGDTTWTVCRGLGSDPIYEEVGSKEAEDANGPSMASLFPENRLVLEAGATHSSLCSQTRLGAQQCHHTVSVG